MKETQKHILEKEIQELEDYLRTLSESIDETDKDKKLKDLNFQLGQKFAELDEYDRAIEHFENAISFLNLLPEHQAEKAEVYYHLAKSYDRSEQDELAFNTYHQALGFDNEAINGFIYYQLGNWYFGREEWKEAVENYEKAIDCHVNTGKLSELGKSYHIMGAVYANQQMYREALQNFEKSFEWNTQTQNYSELGKSFFNLRIFLQNAMSFNNRKIYYQNLLRDSYENKQFGLAAFIYHNLGLWLHEDGQYGEALKCFEKSIQYKQENHISFELGSSYYHAGSCYEHLGEHPKAFEYHVTALFKMLDHASYDEIGMVIYFLQTSFQDIHDNKLKSEAIKLIKEAEALGYGVEIGDLEVAEEKLEAEPDDDILTPNSLAKTVEEVAEIEEQLEAQEEEEIHTSEDTYESLKNRLPDSAEEFGLVSLQRVKHLFDAYKDAWFGKKRKKQIFEETKMEVLKSLDQLSRASSLTEDIQKKLTNWKSEIERLN